MQLIYEGKDISNDISVRSAKIFDRAGEKLDCIELEFNNPDNEWSSWKPEKNHQVILEQEGFSSGIMYIHSINQLNGFIKIICLPIQDSSKEKHTKSWEDVTLMEILHEISFKNGLQLKTYGIQNYRYRFVSQVDQSDFLFLHTRCLLEGYVMKVSDNSLVVYDERLMENQSPILINRVDVLGEYTYKDGAIKVYGSAKLGDYTYTSPEHTGPVLSIDIPTSSIGEAERFSKNKLRAVNKYEKNMQFSIKFNPGIAAGCAIEMRGFGLADNRYYVYAVIQDFANDKTNLMVRTIPGW